MRGSLSPCLCLRRSAWHIVLEACTLRRLYSFFVAAPCIPHPAALCPQDFMEALYDRIITNEIKMKDDPMGLAGAAAADAEAAKAAAGAGWLDTIMNLIPGRAKAASAEPNDDAIRRTHEHLRCEGAPLAGVQCGTALCSAHRCWTGVAVQAG